ncbi:MAG: CAP domain-containing protein [Protaetiibacter sp.]
MGERGTSLLDAAESPVDDEFVATATKVRTVVSRRTIAIVATAVLVIIAGVIGGTVRVGQVMHDNALAEARSAQLVAEDAVMAQRTAVAGLASTVDGALEARDAVAAQVLTQQDVLGGAEALAPVVEAHAALAAGLVELLGSEEPTADTDIPDATPFAAPNEVDPDSGTDALVEHAEELTALAEQADAARTELDDRSDALAELTTQLRTELVALAATIPATHEALLAGHGLASDDVKASAAAAVEALGEADADADLPALLAAYATTASAVIVAHDAETARIAAEQAAAQAAASRSSSGGSSSSGSSSGSGSSSSGSSSSGSVTSASEQRGVLTETNANRAANGLGALSWNSTLASRACSWAASLASANGDLSHSGNSAGFSWWGENVAYGYGSASAVVAGWMGSAGHRANILKAEYTMMGACSSTSSTGRIYWVQQFGG